MHKISFYNSSFGGLSAIPFYFLVGIWGGEGRERAAFQQIVTAALGNAMIFLALVLIYYSVEPHTFSLQSLAGGKLEGKTFRALGTEMSVPVASFFLISLGLSLRACIWPLHGWFTEVAQEAPSSVFVALCAATVPVGLYIFIRFCSLLLPETVEKAIPIIVAVGTFNLVIGAFSAICQRGLRRLLAFLCMSEVGLVLVGIGSLSSAGMVGAIYQELILGLGLAGFGLFSGIIIQRTDSSVFQDDQGERVLGGIVTKAPIISVIAAIVIASLLGFPGFGGFVGHALIMIGSYSSHPATLVIAGGALLLAAYYLFNMYRSIFLGKAKNTDGVFQDLTFREQAYLIPIVCGLLFFGLYPKPLIELIRPTVLTLLSAVK